MYKNGPTLPPPLFYDSLQLFINLMQGGVSRFHFMYTICGEMCANHILEVLGPRLFDCCSAQINHTQLFSAIMWPP